MARRYTVFNKLKKSALKRNKESLNSAPKSYIPTPKNKPHEL